MSDADLSRQNQTDSQAILLGDKPAARSSGPTQNWRDCFPEIIGRSQPMLTILETVSKVARSDSSVLIHGESGTGKELIAAALHRLSPRAGKRFVAINCSAIPENLLESELFGHEKGAFTGAVNRRAGHFEVAAGGTLFLDEIGDMPQRLQAKLLRVLQERTYTPVGGTEQKISDVRVIAATNIDLEKAVAAGGFRLDLFYRLNVLPIRMPPLRDRGGDVPQLLDHFLDVANRVHDVANSCFFSPEALTVLSSYQWPGNVRELQNLIERLVVLAGGGEINATHLPEEFLRDAKHQNFTANTNPAVGALTTLDQAAGRILHGVTTLPTGHRPPTQYPVEFGSLPREGINLPDFIANLENALITQALERTGNNRNQAAKLLGLNRTTLVERIKKRRIGGVTEKNPDVFD